MNTLLNSFIRHRNERGVHVYDARSIEWVPWNKVADASDGMNLPADASDKIFELMANYNPADEFVAVRVSNTGITIEIFKASELR